MPRHTPVMQQEVITGLAIEAGDTVVDATTGDGGHLAAICEAYGPGVCLIGLDADRYAIERARERVAAKGCVPTFVTGNFRDIDHHLLQIDTATVDRILFDLGMSSYQIDESGRGFSFRRDEPLQMTFSSDDENTAYDVVNRFDEKSLAAIIRGYGEERFARRIARAIVSRREQEPIERTDQLVQIIYDATPTRYHYGRLHPATRTFQAIRMAVNDEVTALEEGLDKAFTMLHAGGRIAAISFHSIEDRIVKQRFRSWRDEGSAWLVTKKPAIPTGEERESNPRSRSAKLRIIEKI